MAGGLGDYGSDESEEEDERSVRGSESSDTDEEELHHRIREKQDAFRRKEREMFLLQEKQAQDALLARGEAFIFLFYPLIIRTKLIKGCTSGVQTQKSVSLKDWILAAGTLIGDH